MLCEVLRIYSKIQGLGVDIWIEMFGEVLWIHSEIDWLGEALGTDGK